ncbi:MAG: ATP-binding protein [Nitrosomonas sp.]|uniref:sensor histidine kinase n=1 Tax=Nitrosomonas sp. TaxID=42353 RepID=UPI0027312AD9|nr:ATP-binding protein [Nitrosomonas sp.]MDP1549279.1 ATP-binding protein [Nitrosomonas sp.]
MTIKSKLENIRTDRVETVKELAEFKIALDEHAIVAITDNKGNIIYANEKFCVISQYSRDELLGKNHRIINSGYHSKEFMRDLWGTIKSGQVWKGDIKNRAKDGSTYWVATTIVPFLDQNEVPYQYIAIRAEITERKNLEERNAAMLEELKEINQELANFSYIVSHDLKAPLRGINTLANWLIADYADKLGAEGSEQLNLIANRVRRLGGLVDGILAYSKAGRNREEQVTVDLNLLVKNTIDLLLPPSHITIEIVTPLPQIIMEPFKAQQLFQNLVSNAIKFIDKPVGRVIINVIQDESYWHFTVADNGPGIESKYFDKIFELFQTLNRRDEVESTGIGLSLVKRIITLQGGKIWVESAVGEGTTFHFTLPRPEQETHYFK